MWKEGVLIDARRGCVDRLSSGLVLRGFVTNPWEVLKAPSLIDPHPPSLLLD